METPQISVLMGVYYRRPEMILLERSVYSILAQSVGDFELLICDDGSTKDAKQLLEKMAQKDGRIHLIRTGKAFSLAEKLNVCLRLARGPLIARMDDDDFSHAERFERQIEWLSTHPKIDFVGCSVELEQDNRLIGIRELPEFPEIKDFLFVQPFIHPTLLFRREVLEAVGGYREEKSCIGCEDYDLLLRLYEKGYVGANIQEALFRYLLPPKGKSKRTMSMRINEARTRFARFQNLGLLPLYFPYVVKPIAVGLIPQSLLEWIKVRRRKHGRY